MTPPVWTNAVAATAWAVAAVAALLTTWRHPAIRRTGWLPLWIAQTPIACWWAFLNFDRWLGQLTADEYRRAAAPLIPVILALWATTGLVFCVRARRSQRVTDIIHAAHSSETHDDRDS